MSLDAHARAPQRRARFALSQIALTGTVLCMSAFTDTALAQPPVTRLAEPARISAAEFDRVSSVRSLADGTMLVADAGAEALLHHAWDRAETVRIGRIGDGPLEYRAIGLVVPMQGDSTLLTDSYSGRWLLLHHSRIVASITEGSTLPRAVLGGVLGSDARGRIGGRARSTRARPSERSDSTPIMLLHRASERVDTIAQLRARSVAGFTRLPASGGRPPTILAANPLASEEHAVLFPDGALAVARLAPYRVDWRAENGRWTIGAELPFVRQNVDARERCHATRRWLGPDLDCGGIELGDWPEFLPPFLPRVRPLITPVVVPLSDGRLLVRRLQSSTARTERYDVVDRRGALVGIVELPIGEVILEHTDSGIVCLRVDADGLQRLVSYTTRIP